MNSPDNEEDNEEIQKISKNFFNLIKAPKEVNKKSNQNDEIFQKQNQNKQNKNIPEQRRSARNNKNVSKTIQQTQTRKFKISDEDFSDNEIDYNIQKSNQFQQQQQSIFPKIQDNSENSDNLDSKKSQISNQNLEKDEEDEFLPEKEKNLKRKIKNQKNIQRTKKNSKSSIFIEKQQQENEDEKQENQENEAQLEVFQKKRKVSQENTEQQQKQEIIDLSQKTIADYVQDSLTRKPKSGNVSRSISRINSRKPSAFIDNLQMDSNNIYKEDENFQFQDEENMEESQALQLQYQNKNQIQKRFVRKQISSSSFSQRPNSMNKKWNDKETSIFYRCLGYFGTDFTTINQYLKTKTVTQIKNKFNKEEKKNPDKIKEALKSKKGKQGLSKLKDTQQLENLKNHYDTKFDIKSQILQEQMKQNIKLETPKMINSKEQILESKQNSFKSQPKRYLEDITEQIDDADSNYGAMQYNDDFYDQNDQNNITLKKQSSSQKTEIISNQLQNKALSQKNIGMLINQSQGKEIEYMTVPRHRKDSQTSNDSVARNIEEHIISIYNKEVENHNNQIKSCQYSTQQNDTVDHENDSGVDMSANTSTKSANQNLNKNIVNSTNSNLFI